MFCVITVFAALIYELYVSRDDKMKLSFCEKHPAYSALEGVFWKEGAFFWKIGARITQKPMHFDSLLRIPSASFGLLKSKATNLLTRLPREYVANKNLLKA
jgi:hypothetical protein